MHRLIKMIPIAIIQTVFIITNIVSLDAFEQVKTTTEQDGRMQDFLKTKLASYNEWLSHRDPLPPNTNPINLKTNKERGDGVDADLTVTNYYMSGHSQPGTNDYGVSSELDFDAGKKFEISEIHFYKDKLLTIGGDYVANGTILVETDWEISVPFEGMGKWKLEASLCGQVLRVINYTIGEDDYIDVDASIENKYEYYFMVDWNNTDFEGLTLGNSVAFYNVSTTEEELRKRIYLSLADTYENMLYTVYQYSIEQQPYKRVLVEYLKEIFSETKFSDIINGPGIITSTPPAPSDSGARILCCGIGKYISLIIGLLMAAMRFNIFNVLL